MYHNFRRWAAVGTLAKVNSSLAASSAQTNNQIEPKAGTWKTWVLTSGSQFRLPAPPDKTASTAEIAQLKDMVAKRDATALDQIAYWDMGSSAYRWSEMAVNELIKHGSATAGWRDMALVDVAIYDATIATWDSKYAYNRLRPSELDASLTTVIPNPQSPAYPSEYAAVAAAASTVLTYLYPSDAQMLADKAAEAGNSRLLAGVEYPSDVAAGADLGKKVGDLVVARGKPMGQMQNGREPSRLTRANGLARIPYSPLWEVGKPGFCPPAVSSDLALRQRMTLLRK